MGARFLGVEIGTLRVVVHAPAAAALSVVDFVEERDEDDEEESEDEEEFVLDFSFRKGGCVSVRGLRGG